MKLSKIDLKWVAIVILGGMLLFSLAKCNNYKTKNVALELKNQKLDSIVNKYGQTIITQEAVVIRNQDEMNQLKHITDSLFNLTDRQANRIKDVIAYYKGITRTVIKDKLVPYKDTVGRKQWEDSINKKCNEVIDFYEKNYISIPRTALDSTKEYKANFTAKVDGIYINSLNIPDSQYIRFNIMKGGFLKKDTYGKRHFILSKRVEVQVLHTNKLIYVIGQNSAIYTPQKKARWLEKAILIGGGIFLGTQL